MVGLLVLVVENRGEGEGKMAWRWMQAWNRLLMVVALWEKLGRVSGIERLGYLSSVSGCTLIGESHNELLQVSFVVF